MPMLLYRGQLSGFRFFQAHKTLIIEMADFLTSQSSVFLCGNPLCALPQINREVLLAEYIHVISKEDFTSLFEA